MSGRRQALKGRFRAAALERFRAARGVAEAFSRGEPTSAERLEEVLRDLHTTKGEARMLGLDPVGLLAHALEDVLGRSPSGEAAELVLAAFDAAIPMLRDARDETPEAARTLDDLTERLRAVAEGAAAEAAPAGEIAAATGASEGSPAEEAPAGTASQKGAPAEAASAGGGGGAAGDERWTHVRMAQVDALAEGLTGFSSGFGRLHGILRQAKDPAALDPQTWRGLLDEVDRLRADLEGLQDAAWALRLVPIEPHLQSLAEHARELAAQHGKRVRAEVASGGTQLERGILDMLREPLVHLLRNAVDHGIEPPAERGEKPAEARLSLSAEAAGGHVEVVIADDGRGIDVDEVRAAAVTRGVVSREEAAALDEDRVLDLVFRHGFSTREDVTDVSGRGVGLDVVRRKVESVGGTVSVSARPGAGTRFVLRVPASLVRERVLVVGSRGALYGLPARAIRLVSRAEAVDVAPVAGGRAVRVDGRSIPLRSLAAALGSGGSGAEESVVVFESGGRSWAFAVETVLEDVDVVRRPLDAILAQAQLVGASAVLSDGRLVLLLNLPELIRRDAAVAAEGRRESGKARGRVGVLVVDDSPVVRELLAEILTGAGFEVRTAGDGSEALSLIGERAPDVVVSDVEMPRMTGLELLREIRRRSQRLPVIMVTTRGSAEDRRKATELGADAYLVKSAFHSDLLVETVRRFSDPAA